MKERAFRGRFVTSVTAVAILAGLLGFATVAQAQDGRGRGGAVLRASPDSNFVDVIVVLDESFAPGLGAANQAEAANVARSLGASPSHVYGHALFGFAARVPSQRLDVIRTDPRVKYVNFDELNTIPTPPETAQKPPRCAVDPTGPGCGSGGEDDSSPPSSQVVPWGIERIGADVNDNTGFGIDVYIIDSGIDSDHEDLVDNLGNGHAVEACTPAKKCAQVWDDDNGHGTHVAGTAGAVDNNIGVIGVAPDVTLHAVKVLNKQGSAFSSEIIAGINWVVSQVGSTPVVANISIGGSGSKTGTCNDDPDDHFSGSNAYQEAMCNAAHEGVVFAVSAGNAGTDAETRRPASYYDTSMAVSATGRVVDENGAVIGDGWPYWSNWGNDPAIWTLNASAPVAIAAPGMGILSTWKNGRYETISGTSMASPHVAGAIALYLASQPSQAADYSAFLNARAALLFEAEETTDPPFTVKNGNPHDEDFLDAAELFLPPS